ncbi:glycosyltransferase family 2 protein [Bradyrhizobium sp. LHD-71]|uniref:glycosyltransferase family 2 protein n=1 Tax=Bradyrhizobium sp. LHD-71 TaxID=3072141 RepID=UPI00280CF3A7|nr:glycosyltransferase family 2 protein [Bradyrhizobium sp. LHD-71]MDQ8728368.1 glycosyltransferase family 2 protein [Bradyrhizobium sp. LHD-71]
MSDVDEKSGQRCDDVTAVIVTYNPPAEAFAATLQAIAGQVGRILVVDNASGAEEKALIERQVAQYAEMAGVAFQAENLGLGAAHNIGMSLAREAGSRFALLLDQDSQAGTGMVAKLRAAYEQLAAEGEQVAGVGPRYFDHLTGLYSGFVQVGTFDLMQRPCEQGAEVVEADFLISSGTLVPLAGVETIGPIDEQFFIDYVDTEWCFRARAAGYKLIGVCDAMMTHSLGERRVRFWFPFRWRSFSFHKSFRYYYIARNGLLLLRRSYIPLRWRLIVLKRTIVLVAILIIIPGARGERFAMISRGLYDGVRGATGRLAG